MSDYGYPYLQQQMNAQPVQQQVYPQPQGPAPVEQAMPAPAVGPAAYLSRLGQMLQDHAQQQTMPQTSQPSSSNPYSLNNSQNPYAIEGSSPLSSLQGRFAKKPDDTAKS